MTKCGERTKEGKKALANLADMYATIDDAGREMLAVNQDVEDKCVVVDEAAPQFLTAADEQKEATGLVTEAAERSDIV